MTDIDVVRERLAKTADWLEGEGMNFVMSAAAATEHANDLRAILAASPANACPIAPFSKATYQVTETVTVTADGEETFGELSNNVSRLLPDGYIKCGGLGRIRKGDPILGQHGEFHTVDRQALVAFIRRNPSQHKGPQS